MSTAQKLIRDAVVAAITAQLPAVNIFRAPRRELAESELPCVSIFSQSDRPESSDDDHQIQHWRVYTLRVEARAAARPEEDATDTLATAIRKAILTDDTLGRLASRTTWENQVWDGDENENPIAGAALDFAIHYLLEARMKFTPKPATALVRSTACTHVHPDLPQLTAGLVVEIPLEKLSIALALEGVIREEKD